MYSQAVSSTEAGGSLAIPASSALRLAALALQLSSLSPNVKDMPPPLTLPRHRLAASLETALSS